MKTKSTLFSLLVTATSFAFLTNCSGDRKQHATEAHEGHENDDKAGHASGARVISEASEPQFQVDETFQKQLGSLFSSYLELKEAFIESDAKKVRSEAAGTNEALAKVDMKLVSGAAHNDWMNYLTPIERSLKEIEQSNDIEAQRQSFSDLSDNLYKSVKAFGLAGKEAFYEYCPMAFNNEGAHWLSDQEKIRNPYFGDKMLTCGEVKEKLK